MNPDNMLGQLMIAWYNTWLCDMYKLSVEDITHCGNDRPN